MCMIGQVDMVQWVSTDVIYLVEKALFVAKKLLYIDISWPSMNVPYKAKSCFVGAYQFECTNRPSMKQGRTVYASSNTLQGASHPG